MRHVSSFLVAAIAVAATHGTTRADSIALNLGYAFNGANPTGSAPWLRATFTDAGLGTVTMKLENLLGNNGTTGTQKVGDWYFNVDPTVTPSTLNFSAIGGSKVGSFSIDGIAKTTQNAHKADGDGWYDFVFEFDKSDGGGFNGGESISYTITGTGIAASSFTQYVSQPGGGNGVWLSAAHIQSLPNGDSTWISPTDATTVVPLPASAVMGLSLIGSCGLLNWVRRSRFAESR